MRVFPPAANILVAPHPRLVIRTVSNRRANLRRRGLGRVVEPVIPLATLYIGLQIVQIIDRPPMGIRVVLPLAPVRQRHVIVDSDEIDIFIGPQRIEMKIPVARAILRLIAEILRPIRRIADLDLWPQQRTHFCRQIYQCGDRRKAAISAPYLRQPAHLGTDTKALDTTHSRTERRIVQDKAPITPLVRATVVNRAARVRWRKSEQIEIRVLSPAANRSGGVRPLRSNSKVARTRSPKKCSNLVVRPAGPVRTSNLPRSG